MVMAIGVSNFYPPVFWSGFLQTPSLTFFWLAAVVLAATSEAEEEAILRPTNKLPSNGDKEYKSLSALVVMGCSSAVGRAPLIHIAYLAVELVEGTALHILQMEALVEVAAHITPPEMLVMEDLMEETEEMGMMEILFLVVQGKVERHENLVTREQSFTPAVVVGVD